jgi:iron complex outermembrane recepter protein
MSTNTLLRCISCSALSVALVSPAWSQTTNQSNENARTAPQSDDVIVVTARKREENLQDIPGPVSALSSEDIFDLGGTRDGRELVQLIPGVTFIDSAQELTAEPNIRGAGQARLPNSDSAIGLYRDGAYIAGGNLGGRNLQRLDLFDVERVEVLRGPQGALYGRNAVGGAINTITQKPLFRNTGSFQASYGSRETFETQAIVNVAPTDEFALRLGGDYANKEGCVYTRSDDGECFDQSTYFGVRFGARWQPNDRFEAKFVADYSDLKAKSGAPNLRRTGNPPIDVIQIDGPNDRTAVQSNFNLGASYDLGWADLIGTLNHRRRTSDLFSDPNGVSAVPAEDLRIDKTDTTFAELRLQGEGPRLNWLIGADLFLLNSDYLIQERGRNPVFNAMTMVSIDPNNDQFTSLEQTSYAAYGSLEYRITDRLTLQGEARYSVDEKKGVINGTLVDGTPSNPFYPPGSPQSQPRDTDKNLSWGVTGSYQLTDDILAFARAASAYRAGGFNSELGDPCDEVGEVPGSTCNLIDPNPTYDPEKTLSYEGGFKSSWFDRQLIVNANVYHIEYTDLLANLANGIMANIDPFNAAMFLANAGDAKAFGFEVEMAVRPKLPAGWGRLRIGATVGHQDGEFKQPPAFLTNVAAGNKLARLRDFSALVTAVHRMPLSKDWTLITSGSYRTESGGFVAATNSTILDDFGVFNARIALQSEKVTFAIRASNLTNERYFVNQGGAVLGDGLSDIYRLNNPRYIEASVAFRW